MRFQKTYLSFLRRIFKINKLASSYKRFLVKNVYLETRLHQGPLGAPLPSATSLPLRRTDKPMPAQPLPLGGWAILACALEAPSALPATHQLLAGGF